MRSLYEGETVAIIPLKFWTDYRPQPEGDPKEVDWVEWAKMGSGARTVEMVSRLIGDEEKGKPPSPEWAVLEKAYEAWKKGEELPEGGTPLKAWGGASVALIESLKKFQVKTVEAFAGLEDHKVGTLPVPQARRLKEMAKAWLGSQGDEMKTAAELAELREMVRTQADQIEELKALHSEKATEKKPAAKRRAPVKKAAAA